MWPTFDQDLTSPLVRCYLKRGRSKVSHVDYPLTNIRLINSGQCYECKTLVFGSCCTAFGEERLMYLSQAVSFSVRFYNTELCRIVRILRHIFRDSPYPCKYQDNSSCIHGSQFFYQYHVGQLWNLIVSLIRPLGRGLSLGPSEGGLL